MFEEFKNRYLGKKVDVDGYYGGQCVDLFNAWNRDYNNVYINCQPSGFAKSLAQNKNNNGILKYFQETAINNMIEGTVVVYGNCRFAPDSHVCFFIKDNGDGTYQSLQQNTRGRQYVTIDNNPYSGVIGAFIPNQLVRKGYEKGNYKTLFNMNVRVGAGTDRAIKKVKDLTTDGKRNATSTNPNDNGVYKKGTVFTAKEIIYISNDVWAKTPSGYICIKDSKNTYCEKV